jgi:hydrogenase expression/formation protein HypE
MAHGAGGKATQRSSRACSCRRSPRDARALADAGAVTVDGAARADHRRFVVKPAALPRAGSIGDLAVNGTVNDLAVAGARRWPDAVADPRGGPGRPSPARGGRRDRRAARAPRAIVAGDTKVVERGAADEMYICTTGAGRAATRARLSPARCAPGDRSCVVGPIGEHGTAIMLARGEFELDADIESDTRRCGPRSTLLDRGGPGCAACATPPAAASPPSSTSSPRVGVAMVVSEAAVPVRPASRRGGDPRDRPDARANEWRATCAAVAP